jgi:hypothetical protein
MVEALNTESTDLSANIKNVEKSTPTVRTDIRVEIAVLEGGEQLGTFHVRFERRRARDGDKFTADWGTVEDMGTGLYDECSPPFWPVQKVVEILEDRFELQEFQAIDTGPNDI